MRLDAKGIVLNCIVPSPRPRSKPDEKRAEVMTVPHLRFLEVLLKEGVNANVGEQVNLLPKQRDKVKSIVRPLDFSSLSKGSRKYLKGLNSSEERFRRLTKEIKSNPIFIAELEGSLEAALERMVGSSTCTADQISKRANRILRRYVESHLSGNPMPLGDLLFRAIYGPLAKSAETRGSHYQI